MSKVIRAISGSLASSSYEYRHHFKGTHLNFII